MVEFVRAAEQVLGRLPVPDPVWWSSTEAAAYLAITNRTLYRFIDEGQIVAYRVGRVIRLQEADVRAFVEAARIVPGSLSPMLYGKSDEAGAEFIRDYEEASNGS